MDLVSLALNSYFLLDFNYCQSWHKAVKNILIINIVDVLTLGLLIFSSFRTRPSKLLSSI